MGKKQTKNKDKKNPVKWLLLVVVLPIIVVLTLAIAILTFAGVNVVDWAKNTGNNIPGISSLIKTEEEIEEEQNSAKTETMKLEQNENINELNSEINNLETIIEQLEQDIIKLENRNKSEDSLNEDNEEGLVQESSATKKIAASFRKMNSKQAALIFEDLENEVALDIMEELSNDVRGGILEAMESKKAAALTKMYINKE